MKTSYLPLVCSANAPYDGSCCTADSPCGEDEGDCDHDNDCQDGLQCGSDNCPTGFNFPADADCCYNLTTTTTTTTITTTTPTTTGTFHILTNIVSKSFDL